MVKNKRMFIIERRLPIKSILFITVVSVGVGVLIHFGFFFNNILSGVWIIGWLLLLLHFVKDVKDNDFIEVRKYIEVES